MARKCTVKRVKRVGTRCVCNGKFRKMSACGHKRRRGRR